MDLSHNDVKCGFEMLHKICLAVKMSSQSNLA